MQLEILYADESLQRVDVELADTLRKDTAQYLVLTVEDPDSATGFKRVDEIGGFDHYALIRTKIRATFHSMLIGWDHNQYMWRREIVPLDPDALVEVRPPFNYFAVQFDGSQIEPPSKYQSVLKSGNAAMRR